MKIELIKDVSVTGTIYLVRVNEMTERATHDEEKAQEYYNQLIEKAKNNSEEFGRIILKSEEIDVPLGK